ncbi:substrate-binding domain-containing protein, partial [Deltaproteobacteria bacterium]|nr:substrate-binding domain-containing protein [Deltaproteobacteria bacterium]
MQKKLLRLIFALIVLLVSNNAIAQEQLVIDGTGDSQQLLRQLAQAYEAANPDSKIIVPDSSGSSGGVKALLKGKTDLARIARPLKAKEKAMADDLNYRVFA